MSTPPRFHWRLPLYGDADPARRADLRISGLPDFESQLRFCQCAEDCGIDSLLTACAFYMPDPIPLATALGIMTRRIRFMVAYRPGLSMPTTFVQQINTLSVLCGGRVSLNIVAGHSAEEQRYYGDELPHDERWARADEFLAVCSAFWDGGGPVDFEGRYYRVAGGKLGTPFLGPGGRPEIYVGGESPAARELAVCHGQCWLRFADTPGRIREVSAAACAHGLELGLRLSLIARPTRAEALKAAAALVSGSAHIWNEAYASSSKSQLVKAAFGHTAERGEWLTDYLWFGAVRAHGVSAVCLVGSAEEVAEAILDYQRAGVSQFIFSGWPNREEMEFFSHAVLPRVRRLEDAAPAEER